MVKFKLNYEIKSIKMANEMNKYQDIEYDDAITGQVMSYKMGKKL